MAEIKPVGKLVGLELREGVEVRPQWAEAPHLDLLFADNLYLTRVNDQYYLSFGHLYPSVEQPKDASSLTAELRPVVRLMVPKEALKRMVDLLSRALDRTTEE
jgi:hypothetical protein